MTSFFDWVSQTALAQWIQYSATAFPWIESAHVLSLVIVVGSIVIVDLRLLGYRAHRLGVRRLILDMLPFTWVAFAFAVITGGLLFVSNAAMYWQSWVFVAKMGAIVLAGVNMAIFHLTAYRKIGQWDEDLSPPAGARLAGATSLGLWILIVFLGRWIGFSAPFA